VATVAKDSTAAYDPRQLWTANLAPLVTAAREGAAHAARTAGRERARARQESQWWRQHWLIVAVAGLVVAGAAGGAYAATATRRSSVDSPPASSERSTMETGRGKVAGLARTVAHKFRGGGGEGDGRGDGPGRLPGSKPAERPAMATPARDESRNAAHPTDRPY
jgi:hypothetical protein